MKSKTIDKIIRGKFNSWLKSIDDEKVRNVAENGTIVTGGCITSFYLNEDVNDFDLYFTNLETARVIAEYYVKRFNTKVPLIKNPRTRQAEVRVEDGRIRIFIRSSGVASDTTKNEDPEQEEFIDSAYSVIQNSSNSGKYDPIFLTSNAITLKGKVQLIIRFYGNPDEIHKNYDFIHVTNYWTPKEGLVIRKEALESILTKELKYVGSLYPICSILRLRKFIRRGWTINGGQILKMAFQINELDLSNPKVLADQLVGVDVYYFYDLINTIEKNKPEVVDSLYISRLIDEIF